MLKDHAMRKKQGSFRRTSASTKLEISQRTSVADYFFWLILKLGGSRGRKIASEILSDADVLFFVTNDHISLTG